MTPYLFQVAAQKKWLVEFVRVKRNSRFPFGNLL